MLLDNCSRRVFHIKFVEFGEDIVVVLKLILLSGRNSIAREKKGDAKMNKIGCGS